MKILFESTDQFADVKVDGVSIKTRVWRGVTEKGIECFAYIPRIVVHKNLDHSQFEAELHETPHIQLAGISIPLCVTIPKMDTFPPKPPAPPPVRKIVEGVKIINPSISHKKED